MTVKEAITIADFCDAMAIRLEVFIKEQNVPAEIEMDSYDKTARHFIACSDGEPAGCIRMIIKGEQAKLGRLAVLKKYRGQGVGRLLCEKVVEEAKKAGLKKVVLGAQIQAREFYEKIGFIPEGDIFMEAGMEHIHMSLDL